MVRPFSSTCEIAARVGGEGDLLDPYTRPAVLLLHNLDTTWPSGDIAAARQDVVAIEEALVETGHVVVEVVAVQDPDLIGCLRGYRPANHIVFNGCEELPGVPRSEGQVVQVLEARGFTYTGSPADVLARSWDKVGTRRLLEQQGLPVPRWRIFRTAQPAGWDCFPAIVKPAYEHCSIGVTTEAVVFTPTELTRRIAYVLATFHQPALVEDFIDGREFHVGLWGNGVVELLPPAEMDFAAFADPRDRLCTYDSKFCPGSPHYERVQVRVPAALMPEESRRLEHVAQGAYRALGCRDYARLDLRLRDGTFYVLDVNPNPDISPETSLVEAARVAGYPYGALLGRLVYLAAQRHPVFGKHRY
jgi:D-alanine-D-alanine ligase